MHKYSTEDKVEMAVERLMRTTKTVQQISRESGCTFERVTKLAHELMSLERGILEHRMVYSPVELRTDVQPDTKLNMKAWRTEANAQDKHVWYDSMVATHDGKKANRRSGGTTADMLAKYKQRSV